MTFAETGLPRVPASPHVPEAHTPAYYVSSGLLGELGVVSEGVGYTVPFKMFAAGWVDGSALAKKLNGLNLAGVLFRPTSFTPFYGKFKDQELQGVQVHIAPRAAQTR